MIEETLEVDGQKWRVKARSYKAALSEISFARCTGSVGSSSSVDKTLIGGSVELIAEVYKLNDDGTDRKPS